MAIVSIVSIILIHLFIISKMIFFPYPELFVYPYLTNIGLTPYAQILDQHFPGLMFLPINLGTLGLDLGREAYALHIFVIIATHLLIFWTSKLILKDNKKALIANIFYMMWHPAMEGSVLWIDSFVPLLLIPSFAFFYKYLNNKKSIFIYLSALFLGFTLVLKQVVLPLILVLTILIFLFNKKIAAKFLLISAIPMFLVSVYFFSLGVFNDFFYWTVTFNLTTFAQMGRKYPTVRELAKFGFIAGPALIYLLLAFRKSAHKLILAIFLFGSLIFAYARFDFVHLQPALVFVAIATAVIASKLNKNILIIYILISVFFINTSVSKLKGHRTMFLGDFELKLVEEIEPYIEDKDPIFAMGTTPHIYQLTRTRPSGNIFVFHFPWFMVEAEDRVLEGLISEPPKLVIRDATATTQGMNLVEFMPQINAYISQNYYLKDKIGDTEILLPNEDSN